MMKENVVGIELSLWFARWSHRHCQDASSYEECVQQTKVVFRGKSHQIMNVNSARPRERTDAVVCENLHHKLPGSFPSVSVE